MTVKYVPPVRHGDEGEHTRRLAVAVNGLLDGSANNVGGVTLRDGQLSTPVIWPKCTINSRVQLTARSADAAAVTGIWVDTIDGSFVIYHDNPLSSFADFDFTIHV